MLDVVDNLLKMFNKCSSDGMDVTFVGPPGAEVFGFLVNPFTHAGIYSYYSLNIASIAFPHYKGYLFTNDGKK